MSPGTDAVMGVLQAFRAAGGHRTVAELARAAGTSQNMVRVTLHELDARGQLSINRDTWPHGYRLGPQEQETAR
jgi:DNA-binding IclR family transcriptional regulator